MLNENPTVKSRKRPDYGTRVLSITFHYKGNTCIGQAVKEMSAFKRFVKGDFIQAEIVEWEHGGESHEANKLMPLYEVVANEVVANGEKKIRPYFKNEPLRDDYEKGLPVTLKDLIAIPGDADCHVVIARHVRADDKEGLEKLAKDNKHNQFSDS